MLFSSIINSIIAFSKTPRYLVGNIANYSYKAGLKELKSYNYTSNE